MINSITIDNFRCFEHLEVKGFKNINLFTGLNNSGKTTLLEAILLATHPYYHTIDFLNDFRKTEEWMYFFNNQDISKKIKLYCENKNNEQYNFEMEIKKGSQLSEKGVNIAPWYFDNEIPIIKGNRLNSEFSYYLIPDPKCKIDLVREIIPIEFHNEVLVYRPNSYLHPLFHTSFKIPDIELFILYHLVYDIQKKHVLIDILKLIDNDIIDIHANNLLTKPGLCIKKKNGISYPLNTFNNCIIRLVHLLLILITKKSDVILIEEIENGLHHSIQEQLWTKLFELIDEDVQLFVTSQSSDMIKAFNKVTYGTDYENKATYFELFESKRRNTLVCNKLLPDVLNLRIEENDNYRGET